METLPHKQKIHSFTYKELEILTKEFKIDNNHFLKAMALKIKQNEKDFIKSKNIKNNLAISPHSEKSLK
ncbi:hypothetical protein B6S12_00575 [Helicobacter valdiviensis]|uniref:Uncharacterized protein n=1 Tax=Helicobacter valdiviensis TaxID=1458358 RepID=A0A2W6MYI2_9HELI|nr:hypothetical protein [Helicobacter valdiviensis]PZT49121.1 hypothetical protein B6S12_00575 [Helicobacter valdiviensis]